MSDVSECIASKSIESNSDARATYELACTQLQASNYIDGFRNYRSRWEAAGIARPVHTDRALLGEEWRGQDLRGKRILLHAEQGFGDTIQFIRYAPLVAELGADEVVVEVQPAMRELAACMDLNGCTVGNGVPLGVYAAHCALLDLPLVFGTTVSTIPPPIRMNIPEGVEKLWRGLIRGTGRRKVGLVWAGSASNPIDAKRSVRLDEFRPVLEAFGDAEFFSFQVGPAAEQLRGWRHRMHDLQSDLRTFVDTAAALRCMDLVITVETAVAHLAGSLGLNAWVILSHSPCWRWLLERRSSPWYPTVRLFRQEEPGDWGSVMRQLVAERTLQDKESLVESFYG